jgi:hypothetical protein
MKAKQLYYNITRLDQALFTIEEFTHWLDQQQKYRLLCTMWELSDRERRLLPSIVKLDKSKPYTLDNITLTTYGKHRSTLDNKELTQGPQTQAIQVLCNETGQIFSSCSEAERALKLNKGSVAKVIRGENKTTKGYTFKKVE